MRLDKFLSESTDMSRKEIKNLIKQGCISLPGVRGKITADIQVSESDTVYLNNTEIKYKKYVYLVMNKPSGYVSATYDKHDKTVVELIPAEYQHYNAFPVGRLDIDTEGLLILTNDGQFAHEMTSPKKHVYKTYYTECDFEFSDEDITLFSNGMNLGDFTTQPAVLKITEKKNVGYISICEGKFHQVKRMCEKVGKKVTYLKRVSIGNLILPQDLEPGECFEYSLDELNKLIKG